MANATKTAAPADKAAAMQTQYGSWPYPVVPLLASLPSTHPFELHTDWLWDRCGSGPAPAKPRIWLAGCGTFQPYVFAVANPHAEILATDLSEPSLRIAERRCRLHRKKNVSFAPIDLGDESTWPDGEFDLIECYGVLMNLPDPLATLRGLRSRLTPRGVLRLMVYPQYSRSRVFQIQRVAKLLGLHAGARHHPSALRSLMKSLPRAHPLRYAFTSYHDSRNDAGVVDAFLHAGDRGFTGFQIGGLLESAGLVPEYWFHRPWAQPDRMAEQLGFEDRSQSFVLNYLDLWQELRTNFIVCVRRDDAPQRECGDPRAHPMFRGAGGADRADAAALRHRLRLSRLRLLGGRVPTRTGDGQVVLRAADARALHGAASPDALHDQNLERLRRTGLVLGGVDHASQLRAHKGFAAENRFLHHSETLRVGRRAPNPLYAHLFAAFELAALHPELGLPDVESQIGTWLPWADPLEEHPIAFGLTPYATYTKLRQNVVDHLERGPLATAPDYGAVKLRNDAHELGRVRTLVRAQSGLPQVALSDGAVRELWTLLMPTDSLFVTFE